MPAHFCAVAKSFAGEMIVSDFNYHLGADRFPFAGPLRAPAARTARGIAREAGRFAQRFEFVRQRAALLFVEGAREADMMKQAVVVVEPQ